MPEGSHRFQVGSINCTVLSDGYYSYPSSWLFPNADPADLSGALVSHHLPPDDVLSPYTCLLIETGRHIVLVDTGAGEYSSTSGAIQARLEMAGIRPKDVDTVILTHAHPDHIGGAIDLCGRPAFPNARYVLSELEWEFWTGARTDLSHLRVPDTAKESLQSMARRSLGVLRHQIEPIDHETEIVPGVAAIPAPGHTPGHLAVLIASDGHQLLNLGDAAVHPLHLEHPSWENGFDLDPDRALATRRQLMERAVAHDMHLMAFHFPFPSVGRVAANDGGWLWTPGW
ncbi:MAG: MBL fold metallo-hydrolase [Candidatus Solibacter sp.]|jgi:glyoxylase-like metal-dependent hydrolase (beta-lactamase superfamily II)